jgi:hypothetical protein
MCIKIHGSIVYMHWQLFFIKYRNIAAVATVAAVAAVGAVAL